MRLPALAGLLVVVATAFVACDDGDDGDTADAAAEATTAVVAAGAAAEAPTVVAAAGAAAEATTVAVVTDAASTTDPAAVSLGGTDALGAFLVGPNGHTLYVFTRDEPGVSNCGAGCIANWPPLLVPAGTQPSADGGVGGDLATIVRDDGARQVTYDGAPLYFWVNDGAPGETNGHEVGGVWFVAAPGTAAATGGGAVDYYDD